MPGPGDADGKGKFKADLTDTTLCYKLKVKNIAEATAAHIHVGDSETAGPVAVTLEAPSDGKSKACLTAVPDEEDTGATLGESELAALTAGLERVLRQRPQRRLPGRRDPRTALIVNPTI